MEYKSISDQLEYKLPQLSSSDSTSQLSIIMRIDLNFASFLIEIFCRAIWLLEKVCLAIFSVHLLPVSVSTFKRCRI